MPDQRTGSNKPRRSNTRPIPIRRHWSTSRSGTMTSNHNRRSEINDWQSATPILIWAIHNQSDGQRALFPTTAPWRGKSHRHRGEAHRRGDQSARTRPNRDPPGSKTSGSAWRICPYPQFLQLDTTRHNPRHRAAMRCRSIPGDKFAAPDEPIQQNVGAVDTR
jgi:hypothetical protein